MMKVLAVFLVGILGCLKGYAEKTPLISLKVEQLTSGKKHHFFGYIGQCQTIPWNASGRYVLGLEVDRIDRMPNPDEASTVFVIDTEPEQQDCTVRQNTRMESPAGHHVLLEPVES